MLLVSEPHHSVWQFPKLYTLQYSGADGYNVADSRIDLLVNSQ